MDSDLLVWNSKGGVWSSDLTLIVFLENPLQGASDQQSNFLGGLQVHG